MWGCGVATARPAAATAAGLGMGGEGAIGAGGDENRGGGEEGQSEKVVPVHHKDNASVG